EAISALIVAHRESSRRSARIATNANAAAPENMIASPIAAPPIQTSTTIRPKRQGVDAAECAGIDLATFASDTSLKAGAAGSGNSSRTGIVSIGAGTRHTGRSSPHIGTARAPMSPAVQIACFSAADCRRHIHAANAAVIRMIVDLMKTRIIVRLL